MTRLRSELVRLVTTQSSKIKSLPDRHSFISSIYDIIMHELVSGPGQTTHPKIQSELSFFRTREEESRRRLSAWLACRLLCVPKALHYFMHCIAGMPLSWNDEHMPWEHEQDFRDTLNYLNHRDIGNKWGRIRFIYEVGRASNLRLCLSPLHHFYHYCSLHHHEPYFSSSSSSSSSPPAITPESPSTTSSISSAISFHISRDYQVSRVGGRRRTIIISGRVCIFIILIIVILTRFQLSLLPCFWLFRQYESFPVYFWFSSSSSSSCSISL